MAKIRVRISTWIDEKNGNEIAAHRDVEVTVDSNPDFYAQEAEAVIDTVKTSVVGMLSQANTPAVASGYRLP